MPSILERKNSDGTVAFKIYWSLPRAMVPAGQKKATASLTVYQKTDAMEAYKIALEHKHAITGDQVSDLLEERRIPEVTDTRMTLERWYRTWIAGLGADGKCADRQIETYKSQFEIENGILDGLGALALADIESHQLKKFFKDLIEKRGISIATAARYRAALRACLYEATRSPKLTGLFSNPAAGPAWRPKVRVEAEDDRTEAKKFFTGAQYASILDTVQSDSRMLIRFLGDTGVRFSEATALRVEHVDWANGTARVYTAHKRSYSGKLLPPGGTKGESYRGVEITPTALGLVKSHADRLGLGPKDFIFRGPAGGKIHHSNFVNRRWAPMMSSLSICPHHAPEDPKSRSTCSCLGDLSWTAFRPHALRHSWATWQILAGTPISFVSKQLGHPDTRFTERTYVHLVGQESLGLGMTLDKFLRAA